MKQWNFMLAIMLVILIPTTIMAGIRKSVTTGECYIGRIVPSYAVTENRVTYDATIFIRDSKGKPVPGTLVEGVWRGGEGKLSIDKCTTGAEGECSIPHVVKLGEKPESIPKRGIMIVGVECPDLTYIYVPNGAFAWAVLND